MTDLRNPVEIAIIKFQNHPSLLTSKDVLIEEVFNFPYAEANDILKKIDSSDSNKAVLFKTPLLVTIKRCQRFLKHI